MSDFDEINLYQSNPNKADSDDDGVSDFIEVVSESDPISPFEAFVDPFYVTAIEVSPVSVEMAVDEEEGLDVVATFSALGRTELIAITQFTELLEYSSQSATTAVVAD